MCRRRHREDMVRPPLPEHANTVEAAPQVDVPAGFDTEAFVRNAKVYFVRLQDAWDRGNSNDIREFTTPEMFAEVKLDIDARGYAAESHRRRATQRRHPGRGGARHGKPCQRAFPRPDS